MGGEGLRGRPNPDTAAPIKWGVINRSLLSSLDVGLKIYFCALDNRVFISRLEVGAP
jgi:hypothetical protein